MPRTSPYPSDLSDTEWALLKPLLESSERRGRPPKWPARRVADAVFYLLRSGCAWRMLPREYPPWQTVYYHFGKWRLDGRLRQAHDRLREAVREAEGRDRDPSGAVIDSQAVKGTGVGGPERGYDGAKRLSGRKRHILVDTGGLVLGARVHAASLHDRDGARGLMTGELKEDLPRLELVWADGAYTRGFREWAEEERGWRVEVPLGLLHVGGSPSFSVQRGRHMSYKAEHENRIEAIHDVVAQSSRSQAREHRHRRRNNLALRCEYLRVGRLSSLRKQ